MYGNDTVFSLIGGTSFDLAAVNDGLGSLLGDDDAGLIISDWLVLTNRLSPCSH